MDILFKNADINKIYKECKLLCNTVTSLIDLPQQSTNKSKLITDMTFHLIYYKNNGIMPIIENTQCWWCRQTFNIKIKEDLNYAGIPIKYDNFKKSYMMYGINCSWSCRKALIESLYYDHIFKESMSLLNSLFIQCNNKSYIIAAPHWALLKNNGGSMDIIKFRENKQKYHKTNNIKKYTELSNLDNIQKHDDINIEPIGYYYEIN